MGGSGGDGGGGGGGGRIKIYHAIPAASHLAAGTTSVTGGAGGGGGAKGTGGVADGTAGSAGDAGTYATVADGCAPVASIDLKILWQSGGAITKRMRANLLAA